jgi:hypothetical protein
MADYPFSSGLEGKGASTRDKGPSGIPTTPWWLIEHTISDMLHKWTVLGRSFGVSALAIRDNH